VQDTTNPTIDWLTCTGSWYAGTTGNNVTFSPIDANPDSYAVYINGTIFSQGSWNSTSEVVTVLLDSLEAGTYNLTVVVTDVAGNQDSHELLVVVYGSAPPVPMEMILAIGVAGALGVVIIAIILIKKRV